VSVTPAPYTVVTRIPDDLPFVARPSALRRGAVLGAFVLGAVLLLACVLGLAADENSAGPGAMIAVVAVLGLLLAAVFGLQVWLLTSGGPVLAVGPAGLWIKTRPTRGQAMWLPWEAIEVIYRRRWGFEKMLCVKPWAPNTGAHLGAFTAFDAGIGEAVFGTGLTAPLRFGDRREADILAAVAAFSAGRVRLQ
jgi:hypothetical protein